MTPTSTSAQWATFFLGNEMFGFAVDDVQEVLRQQPITPVPLAPAHIVGLISLRGDIMPAIDLRRLLGASAPPSGPRPPKLLILRSVGSTVALLVDAIGDVLDLPASGWRAAPETMRPDQRRYVSAIHPIADRVLMALRKEPVLGEQP